MSQVSRLRPMTQTNGGFQHGLPKGSCSSFLWVSCKLRFSCCRNSDESQLQEGNQTTPMIKAQGACGSFFWAECGSYPPSSFNTTRRIHMNCRLDIDIYIHMYAFYVHAYLSLYRHRYIYFGIDSICSVQVPCKEANIFYSCLLARFSLSC